MEAPTFEWKDDVLVTTLGDACVAFMPPEGKVEQAVEMAAYVLWAKEHEHDGWIQEPFDPDNPPPAEELLAAGELAEAYYSDRLLYVEEAKEAYRFAKGA